MKFIITLPDCDYYLWQMLVQINNFKKHNLENDVIYLIGKHKFNKSDNLNKILKSGLIKSQIIVFDDKRNKPKYSPSLRPFLMKMFIKEFGVIKDKCFYSDPDVIFTKKTDFSELVDDDVWYMSNTASYLGSNYIKSKGDELFKLMCSVVGIDENLVIENDINAGGAQIILKNTNYDFWDKVENDSEKLYELMINTSHIYCPQHPIQAWTSEMWTTLWNAWLFGHKTKIIKKMDFSWATDPIDKWNYVNIFHNAGAIVDNDDYFLKTKYQKSPFNQEIICGNKYCSAKYVEEIKDTEKNFSKILF